VKKDKYLVYKANNYGLRLIQVFKKKFEIKIFEYAHGLFSETQIKSINKLIYKEMSLFSQNAKMYKLEPGRHGRRKVYLKHIDEDFLKAFRNDLAESVLDGYAWSKVIEKMYLNKKEAYYKLLEEVLNQIKINLEKKCIDSPLLKNTKKIKSVFKLSEHEIEILTFMFLIENDNHIKEMFDGHKIDMSNLVKSITLYSRFFNIPPRKMKDYLSKDSKMVKSGLLEKSHLGLKISQYVETYFAGISKMDLIDNYFKLDKMNNTLSLQDHIVPSANIASMVSLLRTNKGCNILLYGKPGTGKTEFSKTLAEEVGCPVYYINQYDEEGEENLSHRKSAIIAAQNILKPNCIIVVDECDPIINTMDSMWACEESKTLKDSKAWINDLLERTKHKVIWITNRTGEIDPSTKRRFSYSQEFKDLTKTQRLKVWEIVAAKNKITYLNKAEMVELAAKYRINAGGISLATQDVSAMKSLKSNIDKKVMLENLLKQHEKFQFGKVSKLVTKSSSYSSNVLNLDTNPDEILNRLRMFTDYLKENPVNPEIHNMNVLFYGPPGTGKTEFVKHLAESLGLEVNLKRLSDIKSMWYGESLKNISRIFTETEESGKILFLDEADSFFTDRQNTHSEHSKEETNELLTQMENFKGIMICSTNLMDGMDQAVMRRFTMKISFGYLDDKGKEELFHRAFGDVIEKDLDQELLNKLSEIKFLTPGDFKVVKHKHFFEEKVASEVIISELARESGLKRESARRIGL